MRRLRATGLSLALSFLALSAALTQAGAAKPQPGRSTSTASPISTLAMDGPRVAYMMESRRVGVWNVITGATSPIKGSYPSNGRKFGYGTGSEVAIAGKRVALITRFETGNTLQTQERLYTASVGGSARQLGGLTNHSSNPGDCTVPNSGFADGNWLGGLVGSGKVLAVGGWKASNTATTGERLSLITPTTLKKIASGPGAIVPQSADGGHIAVLRSTDAWPAYQGPVELDSPLVGIYSTSGTLLHEIPLEVAPPNLCVNPNTFVRIALSGSRLVVLRLDEPEAGSLTATVEVYDWTTGALVHTWPITLSNVAPISDRLFASGRIAVITGAFRLRLLDLTTGKTATVAGSRANSPATIGSRGLVYALNRYRAHDPGKLVFVPTANLLAALSN